jgi:hypothetical protein
MAKPQSELWVIALHVIEWTVIVGGVVLALALILMR